MLVSGEGVRPAAAGAGTAEVTRVHDNSRFTHACNDPAR